MMLRSLMAVAIGNSSRICRIPSRKLPQSLQTSSFVNGHTQHLRSCSADASGTPPSGPERWDLCVAVLLERLPVISQPLSQMEKEFQQYLWSLEYEKSLKSNHELRHELDLKQAEQIRQGKLELDVDEMASKQTAQDLEDMYNEEFNKFQLAPRLTADDAADNRKSINRCLDSTLYLLVEQQLGSRKHLILPQGQRREGESLRQTAERVLLEHCGEQMSVQFLGNAPCGFHKYKYPKEPANCKDADASAGARATGAKLFFYRATLQDGNVDEKLLGAKSYQWLTKESLSGQISNRSYLQSVQKFLL